MIQLGLLLVAGGVIGAMLRQRRNHVDASSGEPSLPVTSSNVVVSEDKFDDVGELKHYQTVSWYAFALSTSGALFFPPATLLSLPLVGYNSYNFFRVVKHSKKEERKSAMVVFESIAIAGSLLTNRPIASSILFLAAFGSRKFWVYVGNLANNVELNTPATAMNSVWVLRDGVEVETARSQVHETDIIIVNAGENIPLEGVVIRGEGEVKQFGLMRKMKTLSKQVGDSVYPMTKLGNGKLYINKK